MESGHKSAFVDKLDLPLSTQSPIPAPRSLSTQVPNAMFSQIFYLVRSKTDGQYLVARAKAPSPDTPPDPGYLLMFKEHADALSYLNTHGAAVANRFAIESLPGSQLKNLLKRWGFIGVGMVQDPLLPRIEFLQND
jgi:hypothetical protein